MGQQQPVEPDGKVLLPLTLTVSLTLTLTLTLALTLALTVTLILTITLILVLTLTPPRNPAPNLSSGDRCAEARHLATQGALRP